MNNKNDVFEPATLEIIRFEAEDIIKTSGNGNINLPFDPFSLNRYDIDFLNALENIENE